MDFLSALFERLSFTQQTVDAPANGEAEDECEEYIEEEEVIMEGGFDEQKRPY
ncbi:12059_t:CDS:1, partial [Acaulospora colombiana]